MAKKKSLTKTLRKNSALIIIALLAIGIVLIVWKGGEVEYEGSDGSKFRLSQSEPKISALEQELEELRKDGGEITEILLKDNSLIRLYKDSLSDMRNYLDKRLYQGEEILNSLRIYNELSDERKLEVLHNTIDFISESRIDRDEVMTLSYKLLRKNEVELRKIAQENSRILKKENETLKIQLAEAIKTISVLKEREKELELLLADANANIKKRDEKIAELVNAYQNAQFRIGNLLNDVNILNDDKQKLTDRVAGLDYSLQNLEDVNDYSEKQLDSLQVFIQQMQDENSNLNTIIDSQKDKIDSFKDFSVNSFSIAPLNTKKRKDNSYTKKMKEVKVSFKIGSNFRGGSGKEIVKLLLIMPGKRRGVHTKTIEKTVVLNKDYFFSIDEKTIDNNGHKIEFGKGVYTGQLVEMKSGRNTILAESTFTVR